MTRPKGHIVAMEPDWGTFVLCDSDLALGAKLAEQWRQSFRNPLIGRELGLMLSECGAGTLQCDIHALCPTDLGRSNAVFDLPRVRERCIELGVLTREDADRWRLASEEASRAYSSPL